MSEVIKSFKTTFKKKPLWVVSLIIAIVCGVLIQLIPPQILRNIIDNHISTGQFKGIWLLASLYLGAILLTGLLDFFRELTMALVGEKMISEIRFNMAKKLSKLPISYFDNNSVGSVMSYFTSDVDAVGTLITSGVIGIIADGLKALGIIVSIFLISPKISIYVVIIIPIIFIITRYFKSATLKAQLETRRAVAKINSNIQEIFNGIRSIKLFNKEKYFIDEFQKPLNENIRAIHKTSTFDSIFPCIMQILRAVIITIVVILAAPNGANMTGITIGSIAACVDLISRMLSPIESIAMEFQTIQQAISGLRRIEEFQNIKEEERSYDTDLDELNNDFSIVVNNVSFSYDKKSPIVKNVSFEVKEGSKVALIGRTGAGKSTILNLITGLYCPDCGSIKIGNIDPFRIQPQMRRNLIGIVPQNFYIYDGTVKDAITLYDNSISDEEVIRAAKEVGIHEDIVKLQRGYDTLIGEGETQLSNGQYQLLSLACAIVKNPPVLLLDEVTSGLDALTEKNVFEALRRISSNRTLITISHRISGIVDADKVIILENGEIVESGLPKDLLSKKSWYYKYNQIENLGWKQ